MSKPSTRQQRARRLVRLALEGNALQIRPAGFRLKSGRSSPYFVDMGRLCSARQAAELAQLYAETIIAAGLPVKTLVGAAYKGITLAALTATTLAREEKYSAIGFAYTRKEEKTHGEGGSLVGKVESPAVVIDDIVTAGTAAIKTIKSLQEIESPPAVSALVVSLNRQERVRPEEPDSPDALTEIGNNFKIEALAIATAADLIDVLEQDKRAEESSAIRKHLEEFGAGS